MGCILYRFTIGLLQSTGANFKQNGKFIKIKDSNPEHVAFINWANNLLSSPPKKCFKPAESSTLLTSTT
jgi:hypothetical protein